VVLAEAYKTEPEEARLLRRRRGHKSVACAERSVPELGRPRCLPARGRAATSESERGAKDIGESDHFIVL